MSGIFIKNAFSRLNISSYKALLSNLFFRRNLFISRPADSVSDLGDRREPRNQVKAALVREKSFFEPVLHYRSNENYTVIFMLNVGQAEGT